jgi:hypothetical protein|nr:MAG TPA: hypothetical protein [Bacteriophage sp.]
MVHSKITNLEYNPDKVCYIANAKQAYLYLRNDAKLLDILYFNTKANALVFVFEKNEQLKKLYELWNQHELN